MVIHLQMDVPHNPYDLKGKERILIFLHLRQSMLHFPKVLTALPRRHV